MLATNVANFLLQSMSVPGQNTPDIASFVAFLTQTPGVDRHALAAALLGHQPSAPTQSISHQPPSNPVAPPSFPLSQPPSNPQPITQAYNPLVNSIRNSLGDSRSALSSPAHPVFPTAIQPTSMPPSAFTGLASTFGANLNTSQANRGRVASAEAHLPQHRGASSGTVRARRQSNRAATNPLPAISNPRNISACIEVKNGRSYLNVRVLIYVQPVSYLLLQIFVCISSSPPSSLVRRFCDMSNFAMPLWPTSLLSALSSSIPLILHPLCRASWS